MDAWMVGLIAVIVLGLAAILTGALVDRARNRRARTEMLAPPNRTIPRFTPDQPAPAYLSELQARRRPSGAIDRSLGHQRRRTLDKELEQPAAVRLDARLASGEFVTDAASGRAVLCDPLVLLCADEVNSVREVLPAMERAALAQRPLIISAPGFAAAVLSTAEVNVIQGKLQLALVIADAQARARIGELTAAGATSVSDRQAGYLPSETYGTAPCWVSSRTETQVLTSRSAATTRDETSA